MSAPTPARLRWGILSTAAIGLKKVIPGMQRSAVTSIDAIASRDLPRAQQAAASLSIPRAYGSYEQLLADPDIDAIYNPLPNNLHVPWTIRAAEAGKHVLCEKPIALDAAEAATLLEVRRRTGVTLGEAFMVRTHPQWLRVLELLSEGRIGDLRSVIGAFSYFNANPDNIRNIPSLGGGGLMDIGCYLVFFSRLAFAAEPTRVVSLIDRDPAMRTDRLTSALLEFPTGHAHFTCSTQLVPHQRIQLLGTRGRIEIEVPVNAAPDRPTRIFLDDGRDPFGSGITTETFPAVDQYTLQADAFAHAVFNNTAPPVSLEDAIRNMAVLDAIFRSAETGQWKQPRIPDPHPAS